MEAKNSTPQRSIVNKVIANTISCDSPFRLLPNISTPPSRFTKIINPFDSHLIERLHLPVFSPSVFTQMSTPKSGNKFKWTIDDISSLKPADIDELTVDQHVIDHDPTVESLVQERINSFFSHKVIVPSPAALPEILQSSPSTSDNDNKRELSDGVAQTIMTIPPRLPQHLEDLLKPFLTYTQDQQQCNNDESSLYKKLFDFGAEPPQTESSQSSPALSTGLSPIQLSPVFANSNNRTLDTPVEISEFKDCELSPIGRSPRQSRSACRLNFSDEMSIEASLIVPDIQHDITPEEREQTKSMRSLLLDDNSSMHWDEEYRHVSIVTDLVMISSNSNTPRSKIFTSQKKRLSDSFKDENDEDGSDNNGKDIEMINDFYLKRSKNQLHSENVTDLGYDTQSSTWNSTNMFASTPTKNKD